jgi:ABC-type multidrug transport system permease subunit
MARPAFGIPFKFQPNARVIHAKTVYEAAGRGSLVSGKIILNARKIRFFHNHFKKYILGPILILINFTATTLALYICSGIVRFTKEIFKLLFQFRR